MGDIGSPENDGSSIDDLVANMGEPKEEIDCPIDGCEYSHRSAGSVARHVCGKNTAKHIWANTEYNGWVHFIREHEE